MVSRRKLAPLLVAALAGVRLPAQDLDRTRAVLGALERAPAPGAVVVGVVRDGEPHWFGSAGGLEGWDRPLDRTPLPLEQLAPWLAGALVVALAEREGWELDERVPADVAPRLPGPLASATWRELAGGDGPGTTAYWRKLAVGERRRTAAAIVAAHGFDHSLVDRSGEGAWSGDLPWAVLDAALCARTGMPTDRWLARAAAAIGTAGPVVDEPAAEPRIRGRRLGDGGWEDGEPAAVREAVLAGALRATPRGIADVLAWILRGPPSREVGLFASHDPRRDLDLLVRREYGDAAHVELLLCRERRAAWILWTNRRGRGDPIREIADALILDLLGPETQAVDAGAGWNSAVGIGGDGPDFVPQRDRGHLVGMLDRDGVVTPVEVDLRTAPGTLRIGDRTGFAYCASFGIAGIVALEDGAEWNVKLRVRGDTADGVAVLDLGRRGWLPYRLALERVAASDADAALAEARAWPGRSLASAGAALSRIVATAPIDRDLARALVVVRRDGERWIGAGGFADPDRATRFDATMRVPLGTMTRQLTVVALRQLASSGRLASTMRVDDALGLGGLPRLEQLGALRLHALAFGRGAFPPFERWVDDPASCRPIATVVAEHAFLLGSDDGRSRLEFTSDALPRAVLQATLVAGGHISSWSDFVASRLAGELGMPSLRDVREVTGDRAALRIARSDGTLGAAPVSEVACDGNLWATPDDVASWLASQLAAGRSERLAPPGFVQRRWTPVGARAAIWSNGGPGPRAVAMLLPELDLAFWLWSAGGDDGAFDATFEAALREFWTIPWPRGGDAWLLSGRVADRGRPRSVPPVERARSFAGDVATFGEVTVRLGTNAGDVTLVVGGATVAPLEVRTDTGAVAGRWADPTTSAPADELELDAHVEGSDRLVGVLTRVADPHSRLPYRLDLRATDG